MKKRLAYYTCLLLFLLSSNITYAQVTLSDKFWLSGGVGRTQFPSAMIAAGYEPTNRQTVLIARFSVNGELLPNVGPGIKVSEIGLLYGIKVRSFRFSTGLSNVWGNNRGKYLYTDPDPLMGSGRYYEFLKYSTIGIPAEVRFITSLKHVGIGITGFGNLNSKNSFAGLNLSLYVGRMK